MASKTMKIEEKKQKAVKNTASQKSTMKTSTIEVKVNKIPDLNQQTNKKRKSHKKSIKKQKNKIDKPQNKKTNKSQKNKKIQKCLGIAGLIIAGMIFLFTTPLFNVTEIDVVGNEIVSSEEIISLSQIKLYENMFKNIKSKIKQNVKGNAYIENAEINRILPNKIQITVQERKIRFMVKLSNNYAYVNSQGYILEITEQTKEVPILEGVITPEEEIIVGKRLNNEDLGRLEVVLKIMSSSEENEISRFITNINIENVSEYTVTLGEKNVTVHLGNNSNIETKMLYVKAILQAEDGIEGDIFVNGDLNNGFQPFFRKKV